jgi:hypothetical protein
MERIFMRPSLFAGLAQVPPMVLPDRDTSKDRFEPLKHMTAEMRLHEEGQGRVI